MASASEAYHVGLYFHLEGLRSLKRDEISDALRSKPSVTLNLDGWGRTVDARYSLAPLSAKGSLKVGGRFNIGGDLDAGNFSSFPALYIADNFETAYCEKFGAPTENFASHELALRHPYSFSYMRISGELHDLFDLRDWKTLKPFFDVVKSLDLSTELKELARQLRIPPPWTVPSVKKLKQNLLAPDWRGYPTQFGIPANPQVFGQLLEEAGFLGVIYPSVQGPGNCIATFIRNFGPGSFIEVADELPAQATCKRIDSGNWQEATL